MLAWLLNKETQRSKRRRFEFKEGSIVMNNILVIVLVVESNVNSHIIQV
jgi:hypothetical protein